MAKLNGTARLVIPIAAILSVMLGLHVVQQGDLSEVRACATENQTAIARVDERTTAQHEEVMRWLKRIDAKLE